ncbi:hypothetical protein E5676_scaffold21G003170 [Cucumis melo var. makuwa]|nr:hypothetical protein E6C27_scaffold74G002680 [Cucumis melo var. makuwa]TYK16508.1 hypothetical protein E5676_scaffold21G003170 [Cucumis melo var. makuwa]
MSLKEGLNEEHNNPCGQMRIGRKGKVMRKILGNEEGILMDYNEPSANPSHEPRRGTPGGRP